MSHEELLKTLKKMKKERRKKMQEKNKIRSSFWSVVNTLSKRRK